MFNLSKNKMKNLTREQLAILRSEIVLNSLFFGDYKNSLGIDEEECSNFFDGYVGWLMEDYDGKFWDNELRVRDDEQNLWYYFSEIAM